MCIVCVKEVTSLEGREVSKGYDKYLGREFEVLS